MQDRHNAPRCGFPDTVAEPTTPTNALAMEETECGPHITAGRRGTEAALAQKNLTPFSNCHKAWQQQQIHVYGLPWCQQPQGNKQQCCGLANTPLPQLPYPLTPVVVSQNPSNLDTDGELTVSVTHVATCRTTVITSYHDPGDASSADKRKQKLEIQHLTPENNRKTSNYHSAEILNSKWCQNKKGVHYFQCVRRGTTH